MLRRLFSRPKRDTGSDHTGDLKSFRTTIRSYLDFIESLKSALTEPNEIYGQTRVTKRDNDVTKVTIKDSDSNTQVDFIYRNQDLYIVGLVVQNTLYIDKEVYENDHKKKLPNNWRTVIGVPNIEVLSTPLSYKNILPDGENTWVQIGKLGDSLRQLTQIGDRHKRIPIMTQHLGPFVVAFSEAIRFPVVAQMVQEAFRKTGGTITLSTNLVQRLGLVNRSDRTPDDVFTVYSLLLNWGKLSDRVAAFYSNPPKEMPPLKERLYTLKLNKGQLNQLLGVAVSNSIPKTTSSSVKRPKRDIKSWYGYSIGPERAQLGRQIEYVDFDDNVGRVPPQPHLGMSTVTASADVIGALHLLTVAVMLWYGKKMSIPLGSAQGCCDSREALAVAVDLSDHLDCVLKTAGLEVAFGYEEQLELQRQIAKALIENDGVERVLNKFFEQRFSGVGVLEKQMIGMLVTKNGLMQEDTFSGNECLQ